MEYKAFSALNNFLYILFQDYYFIECIFINTAGTFESDDHHDGNVWITNRDPGGLPYIEDSKILFLIVITIASFTPKRYQMTLILPHINWFSFKYPERYQITKNNP